MPKNVFIVFEGLCENTKHIQLELLYNKFTNDGIKTIKTSTISDGPIGDVIRTFMEDGNIVDNKQLSSLCIAELHGISDTIKKHLEYGYTVICSNWYYSILAYTVKSDREQKMILSLIPTDPNPDIIVCIDMNDIDKLNKRTLNKVKKRYKKIIKTIQKKCDLRVIQLDGSLPEERVFSDLIDNLNVDTERKVSLFF